MKITSKETRRTRKKKKKEENRKYIGKETELMKKF